MALSLVLPIAMSVQDPVSTMQKTELSSSGLLLGISPQSCTETDFEMKTSNFVLFLLISVVSVHFRAIYDETIRCQA